MYALQMLTGEVKWSECDELVIIDALETLPGACWVISYVKPGLFSDSVFHYDFLFTLFQRALRTAGNFMEI